MLARVEAQATVMTHLHAEVMQVWSSSPIWRRRLQRRSSQRRLSGQRCNRSHHDRGDQGEGREDPDELELNVNKDLE